MGLLGRGILTLTDEFLTQKRFKCDLHFIKLDINYIVFYFVDVGAQYVVLFLVAL